MPEAVPFNMPFQEAVDYFQAKGFAISPDSWKDLWQDAHARAFTVARVTSMDILQDIRRELDKALEKGTSLSEFKKNLIPLLQRKGWWAQEGERAQIDMPDGTVRKRLAPWRLETIYRTNLQAAYSVGRFKQMKEVSEKRPYWQYRSILDSKTRPAHAAMNGKVFRHDDPVWNEWYPPAGFNCRCYIKSLSADDLTRRNLGLDSGPVGEHPDEGWGYNVGEAGLEAWQPKLDKYRADLKQNFLETVLDKTCPDDWSDFSDSPCFKRLKKRLTQKDLNDLETLVWARKQGGIEGYTDWVKGVIDSGKSKGELYPVGNLPGKVLDKLKTQPRLSLVVIDDVELLHAVRSVKQARGQALTPEEMTQISMRFFTGHWLRNKDDGSILLCWQRIGDEWLKVVIKLDRRIGVGITNQIITCGVVKAHNLDEPRFEEF